jgi:glutamate N-acetyltransferase/amino-acid N-acetyltransferase
MTDVVAETPTRTLDPLPARGPSVTHTPEVPIGFHVGGATAGIKASGKPDVMLVATTQGAASVAAVFTPNAFAAAPVKLSQELLIATEPAGNGRYGFSSAVISTSGCANAATGEAGLADQRAIAGYVASALGIPVERTLHLSTGLIGTRLPLDKVAAALPGLAATGLGDTPAHLEAAALALRTTDSRTKLAGTTVELPARDGSGPVTVRVSGIAKGVGMIHPRMATMLSVLMTDATVAPAVLHRMLRLAAARTWDQLTVDGDTSTNDTVFLMASADAGTVVVADGSPEAETLQGAIEAVARDLARQQAADGEGASTLLTVQVSGATDDADARAVARAVVSSSLFKAAVHGRDPNWGRIAGAAGNAKVAESAILEAAGLPADEAARRGGQPAIVDPSRLRIAIMGTLVFDGASGGPQSFDKGAVSRAMAVPETLIRLDLGLGDGRGEAFGCDLTEEYVRENSEYST